MRYIYSCDFLCCFCNELYPPLVDCHQGIEGSDKKKNAIIAKWKCQACSYCVKKEKNT